MTLSEYILENTDDGIDIAAVLIDVMNGFIRGVRPSHRLTAARLLTIYGFQDARDFIDDNVPQSSGDRQQWVISDPELARLIRARTNDGQEMCLFLIDVMWGKVEGLRIGHRPNFDPMRAASDDDYWSNYDGCDNISCPYHGDPEDPDFDPNAHHY